MFAEAFARLDQRARNMGEMMQRLGIEPIWPSIDDGGKTLGAAARSCWACGAGEECRAWLDAHPGALDAPPPFCPNSVRFRMMLGGI